MFSCCGCKDDEAWKCAECFCSCHTYAHMDRRLNPSFPENCRCVGSVGPNPHCPVHGSSLGKPE
jgi:hypothetical protein